MSLSNDQNMVIKTILGIRFTDTHAEGLVDEALKGGLVVVPSGPGLAGDLLKSEDYRKAVTTADLAITDSGAMVLFMRLFHRQSIHRVSGLKFLQTLLGRETLKTEGSSFWVHPSAGQLEANRDWLKDHGFPIRDEDNYVAPLYPNDSIEDPHLMELLRGRRPQVIVLCIGGGVQERLGHWLREQYRKIDLPCPAIVCTGAAIGFLSGNQVNIPRWADRLCLGWFFRCLYDPIKFIPRYWNALPLAYLIYRYGETLPPLAREASNAVRR